MSKIADYIEQQERDREIQTVADFAMELKKSPDSLLSQLRKAGVQKSSQTERISVADKEALLRFLQAEHSNSGDLPRETIVLKKSSMTCESEIDLLLKAVLEERNGAEWDVLNHFAGMVIAGDEIDPNLQAAVNLLVAQTVLCEALPLKKLGRPKSQEANKVGLEVAKTYWDLRDKGESYSNALSQLAGRFHKDERHLMRLVEKHKESIGVDFQTRERKREADKLWQQSIELNRSLASISIPLSTLHFQPWPKFTINDYLEYLNERVVKTIKARGSTGIKEEIFIASD